MTHKSSHSMASHSARRPGTRTRPSSSPPPSPSTPPSNYSLSIQHAPSTQGYITSGPAFEISRTVNITVEVSSSSPTPAYNGYDVRNYPPVTTTCYSTEPSSPSASVSSYQYGMYESISSFPDYSNPPSSAGTTAPPSSPFQGYTPSTSSAASNAASTNYSYYASGGYAPEHCGSQSEYSGNQSQDDEEEAEYQVPQEYSPPRVMLERFLTVDSGMDSLAYLARIAIRCGDVRDGEVPPLPFRGR